MLNIRSIAIIAAFAVAVPLALAVPATAVPATAELSRAASSAAPDYCLAQCHDILPPGEAGNATAAQIIAN